MLAEKCLLSSVPFTLYCLFLGALYCLSTVWTLELLEMMSFHCSYIIINKMLSLDSAFGPLLFITCVFMQSFWVIWREVLEALWQGLCFFFGSINAGGANLPEIRVQRSVRWWNCEECCTVEHRELARGKPCMRVVPLGISKTWNRKSLLHRCSVDCEWDQSCSWNCNSCKIVSFETMNVMYYAVKMLKGWFPCYLFSFFHVWFF